MNDAARADKLQGAAEQTLSMLDMLICMRGGVDDEALEFVRMTAAVLRRGLREANQKAAQDAARRVT